MTNWDQEQLNRDARELEKLGYNQELLRGLGGFSNFAVAFSVVSILTGISQLYGYGLQHGGPSQMDLFDPKPYIAKMHGKGVSPPVDGREVTLGVDKYLALAPNVPIRPRGECGMLMSDLLPNLAEMADDLCLLRAVHTDNEAHAPATLQLHTGVGIDARHGDFRRRRRAGERGVGREINADVECLGRPSAARGGLVGDGKRDVDDVARMRRGIAGERALSIHLVARCRRGARPLPRHGGQWRRSPARRGSGRRRAPGRSRAASDPGPRWR